MNKLYKKTYFFLAFIFISCTLFSQNVAISKLGSAPSVNAILDLNTGNSNNIGFLIPNVTLGASLATFNPPMANAATALDKGLIVYNSVATNQPVGYYYWNGAAWVNAGGGGGNTIACGTASSGYLPYFTSTTDICSSVFYQLSTTTVGLGTIVPKNMLDINGALAVGTYAGTNSAPSNGLIVSGTVGIGNNAPNAGAIVDIKSSTLGMLIPRSTTNPAATVSSLMYFNTTSGCFVFYNGTGWQNMACACTSGPAQPGAITGPASYCVNSSGNTYSIVAVAGAMSYTWTVPASVGIIASGQGSTSITISGPTSSSTGTISVTATNGCGTSPASTSSTITVTPTPTAPFITSSYAFACPNQTGLTYTVPAVAGVTYLWAIPAAVGTITAGQGTTTITVTAANPGSTGNVTCTETNVCGSGPAGTFAVNTTGHGSLTFNFTGGVQYWVVPTCLVTPITIITAGASGGYGDGNPGYGAIATSGSITVPAGDTIFMAVGEAGYGSGYGAGGGGASFSWVGNNPTTYPLTAGGGGGGAGGTGADGTSGSTNLTTTNNGSDGAGGTNGTGGAHGSGAAYGGGGAGWLGNGTPAAATAQLGQGGLDAANSFTGGSGATGSNTGGQGGYGGGGGGGASTNSANWGGGGGGGGFSGGGGGNGGNSIASEYGGGGGSSGYYNAGAPYSTLANFVAPTSTSQTNYSDGYITITW